MDPTELLATQGQVTLKVVNNKTGLTPHRGSHQWNFEPGVETIVHVKSRRSLLEITGCTYFDVEVVE